MADISKIKIGDTTYDVKDEVARGGGIRVETIDLGTITFYNAWSMEAFKIEATPLAVLNCWDEDFSCPIVAGGFNSGQLSLCTSKDATSLHVYANILVEDN